MKNEILQQVKEAIRSPYAWPGGYPIYTIMADGQLLCPQCASENFKLIAFSTREQRRYGWSGSRWEAAGAEVYWEGPAKSCAHCGKQLDSAYGDPAEEEATPCSR